MEHNISKVIILGSGALKIGEAGEFDYSGSQAIKALKQEGIYTVLVNPNIATIQTSDHLADKVYLLPVTADFIEGVIKKERPDGILLAFGGQTALNCGMILDETGILEKYNVQVVGTPVDVIRSTEDRQVFAEKLAEIDVPVPRSRAASTVEEALQVAEEIGFPVMIRLGFALGGLGSGVCWNEEEVKDLAVNALSHTSQLLVEEYLKGWKEVEYEVVRDCYDNCITVCNMENFDPLGIHTGESIVIAPSQTLSNSEYHMLREIAIKTVRHLGVIGECNIQYALNPKSEEYRVIEVNARLSRSSALASKATGYPLAFIAAKLGLGYSLTELKNSVTLSTMACFEPALDYVVVKIPRWDLKKFRRVSTQIGSSMKSVGEVMSIGKTFQEALQKALRMLDIGAWGLVTNPNGLGIKKNDEELLEELINPTDERIFSVASALKQGMSVDELYKHTDIDPWFLHKLANIVRVEGLVGEYSGGNCPRHVMDEAKRVGFSDPQLGKLLGTTERIVRKMRLNYGITPYVKQIDTLAGEYPAQTNYLYLTYNASEDDIELGDKNSVMVLGSGPYRIGSSVEFDWCCVNAVKTVKKEGYRSIMINYNPETVSTDYDEVDRLYFDEIRLETVLDIYEKESPEGIVISMGGQVSNNLALPLEQMGAKVLGTTPTQIDRCEDRHKFSSMLDTLGIDQPAWSELTSIDEAKKFAHKVNYPVLVRPSYVLSGAAMGVANNDREIESFLQKATDLSTDHPVVISKFLSNAKEIELDAVAKDGKIVTFAISEHVENAGVHSGDATLVLPPQRTFLETIRRIKLIARQIAKELHITGPFNMQFIAKENSVKVIECNLRASRSFPFVSKVCKKNFIEVATQAILGKPFPEDNRSFMELDYVGVKASHFSFTRLLGADPTLGVEMASTGEVGCLGDDFHEALLKAMRSVGFRFPIKSMLISTGSIEQKAYFLEAARLLQKMDIKIFATTGTYHFLKESGIKVTLAAWPDEQEGSNVLDLLAQNSLDLVVNIPKNAEVEEITNGYKVRRKAVDLGTPLITNIQLAKRLVEAIYSKPDQDLAIKAWDEY
ncbi:MAG: carbamoyl phosphate synthase large subunit [SAR324 cluster bacterium]|uniref:Carbamoyl phosphate synthase large subunit n=1 Tax=SAR324 cluster bacterium TaxID=2024889 RepID=A0A2A4T9A3_9DELT|nr:MAG: carbamoyl phosphate synthase large subunit [SAR324 cluster bacterium]